MIIYQHQPDEAITWRTIKFEEEGDWWAGVQKYAVSVAIAAVVSIVSSSTAQTIQVYSWQQDDPQIAQPNEEYWQNPSVPVVAILQWLQQSSFDEQIPAGFLSGQPDEDFWSNPTAPVPATLLWPQQFIFDEQLPAGSLIGTPEEWYWQNPVAPIPATLYQPLPYWYDAVETTFMPDEDYWQNWVAPHLFDSNTFPQQWVFDEQIPAGNLAGVAEEDFWQNPIPSVPSFLYQRLPYLPDVSDDPAGNLYHVLDEDYWQAPVFQLQFIALFQQWPLDDSVLPFTPVSTGTRAFTFLG